MIVTKRPWRSVLYIPASNVRALDKARRLASDALILDLEDSVTPDMKDAARGLLTDALATGGFAPRAVLVRINDASSPWHEADLDAIAAAGPDAVLLPKVNRAEDIEALAARLDGAPACADTTIWAMMETPAGILNAASIATAPRMAGFVLGTNDLAKDLGCRVGPDRASLLGALQTCLLAARAAGLVCIDGVYNAFKDDAGLLAEAEQGRDLGMDGKTLIHPAQLDTANRIFAPDAEQIAHAERQIAAFAKAKADGRGVAVLDGKIVENLHVDTARATLGKAQMIARREAS